MKNSRTLTLKIAISILTVVFFAVCITSGIVFASITSKISTNVPGVPTARLFSELWTTADTGGQITSGSIPKSSPLYVSATQSNGTEAVEPYCVMRAVATDNVTFDTSNWILQDNGWYYCTQVVGGGSQTRVALGQTTAEFNNANDKIVIELMQFSSDSNGFAKFWSPLAGRSPDSKIAQNMTVDGHAIASSESGSVGSWITNGAIVPYNSQFKQYFAYPASDSTSRNETNTLTAPITADITANTPTQVTISSLNTDSDTDATTSNEFLQVYNNNVLPIVLFMTVTPYIIENGNYSSNQVVNTIEFAPSDVANMKIDTLDSGLTAIVYNQIIMPGEYVNTIPETLTITHSSDLTTSQSIYFSISFNYADVDTFEEAMQEINSGSELGSSLQDSFGDYFGIWQANSDLQTNLTSQYRKWLAALSTSAQAAGLTMPSYTKLGDLDEANDPSTNLLI